MSLAFHARFPGRTRALVLMDTGPGFKSDEARASWNETAERTARGFEERGLDALPRRAEVEAAQAQQAAVAMKGLADVFGVSGAIQSGMAAAQAQAAAGMAISRGAVPRPVIGTICPLSSAPAWNAWLAFSI